MAPKKRNTGPRPTTRMVNEINRFRTKAEQAETLSEKLAAVDGAFVVWSRLYSELMLWAQDELVGAHLARQATRETELALEFRPLSEGEALALNGVVGTWLRHLDGLPKSVVADAEDRLGSSRIALVDMIIKNGGPESLSSLAPRFLPEPFREILSHIAKLGDDTSSEDDTSDRGEDEDRQKGGDTVDENRLEDEETSSSSEFTFRSEPLPQIAWTREIDDEAHVRWKLEALRRVRMRVGKGERKIFAMADIAERSGHSIDTLQEWERQLVKNSDYENDLNCAEYAGEFEGELVSGHYSNIAGYEYYGSYKGVYNLQRATEILNETQSMRLADVVEALRMVA